MHTSNNIKNSKFKLDSNSASRKAEFNFTAKNPEAGSASSEMSHQNEVKISKALCGVLRHGKMGFKVDSSESLICLFLLMIINCIIYVFKKTLDLIFSISFCKT